MFGFSYTTAAVPSSDIGNYNVDLSIDLIDPGLTELYDIELRSGTLFIDPMVVTIEAVFVDDTGAIVNTLEYGSGIPTIEFRYVFGEESTLDDDPVLTVQQEFALQHTSAFNLMNGFSLLNGFSSRNGFSLLTALT